MSEPGVRRVITRFREGEDDRAGEIDVTHVPLEVMAEIVTPGIRDPLLYDCYELSTGQLERLQAHVAEPLGQAGFRYYLEAEAGRKPASRL